MRISLLYLIIALCTMQVLMASHAAGQGLEDINVTVELNNGDIKTLFKKIEKQTKLRFAYDPTLVRDYTDISLPRETRSIKATLDLALEGTPLRYRQVDNSVIIYIESGEGNSQASQQDTKIPIAVSGTVTDSENTPLPGVNVVIKGTTIGTTTDQDGHYTVHVDDESAVLVFSFIGFKSQEQTVGARTVIDVKLETHTQSLGEVVVIGYGTQKKSDLTGSVIRVEAEKFQNQGITQLTEMLTGTIAGFNANQGTTAAGGSSMEIRGPTSLSGGTNPLIVVDGVIFTGNLRGINPNDIETIDILKDASSAAVFGAKAASGVIIITTKKGRIGKPVINFTTKIGITEVTRGDFAVRSPDEYLAFRRDYFRSLGQSEADYHWFSPEDLPEGVTIDQWRASNNNPNPDDTREWLTRLNFFPLEVENYLAGNIVNWRDEVMTSGVRQDYDFSISGGTENIKYYWSLGYVDNEGIIRGDEFSAIRSRLNLDFQLVNWLNVGINAQYSLRDESAVPASLVGMSLVSPFSTMYNEDGTMSWYSHGYSLAQNPLLNYKNQDRFHKIDNLFSSLYAQVQLPFDITYRVSFQPHIWSIKDYNYWPPETIVGGNTYSQGRATREESSQSEWMVDNLLKWNKVIGIHNIDLTFLYNVEKNRTWSSTMRNQTFQPTPVLGYHGMQFGDNPSISTDDVMITGDGLMGRLNYALLDRYFFTASIRRDGFSAFGQENPRATFPAAALGWNISKESFYKFDLVNRLKLRFSWGVNGNRDIGPYAALAKVGSNPYYDGSSLHMGVYTSSLSNPGLVWEETQSINYGLDIGILEDRINLTIDYYDMTTTNLLVNRVLPRITGFNNVTSNIGELGNKGFEVTLQAIAVNAPGITWQSNLNFSLNRNRIKSLFGETGEYTLQGETYVGEIPDFENEWFIGEAIDRIWDYNIEGVWQVEEAAEAAEYNLKPGDFKARDLDENGVYEALQDKMFLGYTQPRYRIGFRNDFDFLRNFSASVFIRADLGHMRAFHQSVAEHSTFKQRSTANYPYWTPDNQSNEYPRLSINTAPYGGGIMPFKSSSFVRIQDVSLAYSLPENIRQIWKIQELRFFASVRNLYSFDNWPGWDPESGHNPMPRTYTLGVNLSL